MARTGTRKRTRSDNTQWGQDRTDVPPVPRESNAKEVTKLPDLERHLSSVDSGMTPSNSFCCRLQLEEERADDLTEQDKMW